MLQAGKLDQRITLRAPGRTRGASGGFKKQWIDQPPMWAAVRNLSGNETASTGVAGGRVAVARTEFTIPFRPDVSAEWGVLYQGRHYNIAHVNDLMARRECLILTCDTGMNDG